jgi:PAS domain S-box-containing protein
MNRSIPRFAWPILLTTAALGLRAALDPWLGNLIPYATFYISATLSAILGGMLPGLLAVFLGTLASAYFFIPPIHTLQVAGAEHFVVLALDATVSCALVVLADRQRRAAEEAAEGRRMLEAVMEHIPEGLTIARVPDLKVRMMSRHGAELLGRTRESMEGKPVGDYVSTFYHSDGKTPAQLEEMAGIRAIEHGEITGDLEWIVKRPDGGSSVVLSRAAPIRDRKGRIIGTVAAWRDITERKRLEEKLRESTKMESLGVLAGGVAHDFNNLLTSVMGHASLLLNDLPHGSTARESAQEIARAAERAARLSRQMLAYSGHGRFQVEPLDLSDYVRQLAPKIESGISKHVQLKLDLADHLPPIDADRSQLKELISNLVCNAVEAIGSDQGRVVVATRLVSVDQLYSNVPLLHEEVEPGTYVELDVSDTGSGMDKDTIARIFEPFFTTRFMGRGLGLAVAHGIVRGHKGRILVHSAPGQGTTMCALFPVPAAGTAPEAWDLPRAEADGTTVLVIDHETESRSSANQALQQLGYTAIAASDQTEGLETFRALKDQVSAVLLDMTMPGAAGEETLRELHKIRPDVAVVLSTGFGEPEARRRFGRHRTAGFLQKPYSLRELAERIHEAVQARLPTA